MLRKSCFLGVLVLTGCATQKAGAPDPLAMIEARLSSMEAQLMESRKDSERLAARVDALNAAEKPTPKAAKRPTRGATKAPRSSMKKSSELPITRLTPEGYVPGDLGEQAEAREETETVVDSRHEGLHLYRQGLQLARDRKFDEALDKFRQFLKENPDHVYADRAQYQIAEAHYGNKEYGLVIVAAQLLETRYPYSFRIPEACYFRAMALLNMGQRPQAADALRDVMRRFPKEIVAENASRKLAELTVSKRSHEDVPLMPEVGT